MPKWREKLENGLPDEGRCPESGYRMAAEGMPFPCRWTSGTTSTNLDVIWGMSVKTQVVNGDAQKRLAANAVSFGHFFPGIANFYPIASMVFGKDDVLR